MTPSYLPKTPGKLRTSSKWTSHLSELLALTLFLSLLAAAPPAAAQVPGAMDTPFNTTVSGGWGYVTTTTVVKNGLIPPSVGVAQPYTITVDEDSGAYADGAGFASSIFPGLGETLQTLAFTVTNDNNTLFSVQPTLAVNGTLTFTPAPNANGKATVTVLAMGNGGVDTIAAQTFTLNITPVDEPLNTAPTAISLSASSTTENVAANSTVGVLSTIDVNAGDTFTYTLVVGIGSTDNAAFNIVGNALRICDSPNFKTKSSYTIRVRTTDQGALPFEQAFTITITIGPEAPTVTRNTADIALSATTLTITGTGFDATTPGNNTVAFTPAGSGSVTAATATSLTVTSLSSLTSGVLNAVVTTNGMNSGAAVQVATVGTSIQDWRQRHFGTTANSGNSGDGADPDSDGLVNLLEYAFGLNPSSGASLTPPQPQRVGDNFMTTFTGVSDVTYAAEWSSTLLPGEWTPIPDTGTGDNHTFSVPIGSHTRMFMRLKVTNP